MTSPMPGGNGEFGGGASGGGGAGAGYNVENDAFVKAVSGLQTASAGVDGTVKTMIGSIYHGLLSGQYQGLQANAFRVAADQIETAGRNMALAFDTMSGLVEENRKAYLQGDEVATEGMKQSVGAFGDLTSGSIFRGLSG